MTREEILKRQEELSKEWCEMSKRFFIGNEKRSKEDKKREWEIIKEGKTLQHELDKIDNKIYNNEKWITKFIGNSYESLKAARFDLINQIKNLPGVEVGEDKTGVVSVKVYTDYKVYYYTIHAHYRVEVIREWEEESPFGPISKQETRNIYQAWCEGEYNNWSWRY